MVRRLVDMTTLAGLTREKGTGPVRTRRPVYVDLLPPCNQSCPAGENIQAWLDLAQAGKYRQAWNALMRDNPLPAVHGRVCYHPCEAGCNRKDLDAAVSIHAVERFLGDLAAREGWIPAVAAPPSGKRVLVVGAGPSGLSAAYHLTRLGHAVEIRDAGPAPGGMLHFGIPTYRLPRVDLMAEIARIEAMGVRIVLNHKVTDLLAEKQEGHFDAAFVAIGAHVSRHIDIPARDAARVLDAISLLREVSTGENPLLGRRVVIYGGGNTAMDAARTARRLGATETVIVYRRTREKMPAHDFEVEEALQEGIMIKWLSTIKQADAGSLILEKMALDDTGFPQPTGEFETIAADSLILALGQDVDLSLLNGVSGLEVRDGVVQVASNMMTGHPGIFAGGDMVPSERTVTVGIGHGKKAARHIDAWLRGTTYEPAAKHELAAFNMLHPWYYSDAPKTVRPMLDIIRRQTSFDEVQGGLDQGNALFEARRCLSCGNCFECDNCYGVCPDNAVIKLGPGKRFKFNFDYCKGCGMCANECPCGAIKMIPEEI